MVPALEHFGQGLAQALTSAIFAQPHFSAAAREKGRLQISGCRGDWYVEYAHVSTILRINCYTKLIISFLYSPINKA